MSYPAPQIKPAQKARAERCAHCGRRLNPDEPRTVVPGLGVVGPTCERHVAERLAHLQRGGLGVLALQGEQRLPALRCLDGAFELPGEAVSALTTIARRLGLTLRCRFDPQAREVVLTIDAASLRGFVRGHEGVRA